MTKEFEGKVDIMNTGMLCKVCKKEIVGNSDKQISSLIIKGLCQRCLNDINLRLISNKRKVYLKSNLFRFIIYMSIPTLVILFISLMRK